MADLVTCQFVPSRFRMFPYMAGIASKRFADGAGRGDANGPAARLGRHVSGRGFCLCAIRRTGSLVHLLSEEGGTGFRELQLEGAHCDSALAGTEDDRADGVAC